MACVSNYDKAVIIYAGYWVAWTNFVCPCLITYNGTKVTGDVAGHCPPLAGDMAGSTRIRD